MSHPCRVLAPLVLALMWPLTSPARTCELSIDSNDRMQFDKSELAVGADCERVRLTLTHSGDLGAKAMGHNWVLTRTPAFKSVAQAGMRAGAENDYVPPDDDRVIAHTDIIGGGGTTSVTFGTDALEAGGDYTFFCSFPGHYGVMNGKLVVR